MLTAEVVEAEAEAAGFVAVGPILACLRAAGMGSGLGRFVAVEGMAAAATVLDVSRSAATASHF